MNYSILEGMKKKLYALFLLLVLAVAHASALGVSTKKGKLSIIRLLSASKLEGAIEDEEGFDVDVEGVVFYFEVSKLRDDAKYFTLAELRDFLIDGKSYADLTYDELGVAIEPDTLVIESFKVYGSEPELQNRIRDKDNGIIMKTTIYGATLPQKGRLSLKTSVGWDNKVEDFSFSFKLEDL